MTSTTDPTETNARHRRLFLARMAGVAGAVLLPTITSFGLTGASADAPATPRPISGTVVTQVVDTGNGTTQASNTNMSCLGAGTTQASNTNVCLPPSKEACKDSGFELFTDADMVPFRNQGDCVSFVASNKHRG